MPSAQTDRRGKSTRTFRSQIGPSAARARVAGLAEEIRDMLHSFWGEESPELSAAREELRDLVTAVSEAGLASSGLAGDIFSSLDPQSLGLLRKFNGFDILPNLWNQIAAYVTPEIVDIYCDSGRKAVWLPFLSEAHAPLPVPAARRAFERVDAPDTAYLILALHAAKSGKLPADAVLFGLQQWLAKWPPDAWRHFGGESSANALTVLRIIATLQGSKGDDWTPVGFPDYFPALEMTRSAHGRMTLHRRLSEPEALLRDPDTIFREIRA